ncbi:DNA polymerase IV [Saliterribacillus persicus]|uniref:DNA polymerase IV n=1 Tax=Saliterribacillus persicus TaxID=930114 RepID=A0A368XA48_9BACI|nr:DNA polymerase IV [Saliterribacillus persicus]RCW64841.1 DNA polymerase-4 [Saliterribacillus persicus]
MSKWNPKNGRVILHVDMNSFYASVEAAYDPSLKGKPIAIAGNPEERKGIIVTSSYEARKKGVKTTMPLWQAKKLCSNLIVMRPNFERYRKASKEMFNILFRFTPFVEPVSIDEGYMDITECEEYGSPIDIANQIQKIIYQELDLPCSIGIAPNKFLAKMASDMKKPNGITILRKRNVQEKLWPLSIDHMYGVGEKTALKLQEININTIGDLASANRAQLKQLLGINGEKLQDRANGLDKRAVDPESIHRFKSIGSSQTLPYDTVEVQDIDRLLHTLSRNVANRLSRKDAAGQTLQLMIRFHNRKTITRSKKINKHIDKEEEIFVHAKILFEENWDGTAIRLLGVTVQDIITKEQMVTQLDLFSYQEHQEDEKLYEVMTHLKDKYGDNIIRKASFNEKRKFDLKTSFQKDFLDD